MRRGLATAHLSFLPGRAWEGQDGTASHAQQNNQHCSRCLHTARLMRSSFASVMPGPTLSDATRVLQCCNHWPVALKPDSVPRTKLFKTTRCLNKTSGAMNCSQTLITQTRDLVQLRSVRLNLPPNGYGCGYDGVHQLRPYQYPVPPRGGPTETHFISITLGFSQACPTKRYKTPEVIASVWPSGHAACEQWQMLVRNEPGVVGAA